MRFLYLRFAVAALALTAPPAFAEMGGAPVPSGTYFSIEGGYLNYDAKSVTGFGVVPDINSPFVVDTSIESQDGYFGGLSLGSVFSNRALGVFDRVEASFRYGKTDDDNSVLYPFPSNTVTTLTSPDGSVSATGTEAGRNEYERKVYDGGLAFKGDIRRGLTVSVEPFVRFTDETISSIVDFTTGLPDRSRRDTDISSRYYGAMVAVEPEISLSHQLSLVGRAGAGIYGLDADGDFKASTTTGNPFPGSASDDVSDVGFRGSLGVGLKLKATDAMTLTAFGDADYWSTTPVAVLPTNDFGVVASPAHLDKEDLWDLRAGVRLTIGMNNDARPLK